MFLSLLARKIVPYKRWGVKYCLIKVKKILFLRIDIKLRIFSHRAKVLP